MRENAKFGNFLAKRAKQGNADYFEKFEFQNQNIKTSSQNLVKMAPSFQDKDLLLQLNHIFDENESKNVKFSIDKIRNPSVDGTRDIIISVLTEMGFALNSSLNILDLPNHMTGPNEFNIVKEFITPMTLTVTANKFFTSLASASGETDPIYR